VEREALALTNEALVKIGAAIRDARIKAGLSQVEVARLTRKGQPYQSEIEAGNVNMTMQTLLLVASTLRTSVTRDNPILECELPIRGARFEAMVPQAQLGASIHHPSATTGCGGS
jgi:type IV secretion system protein VirB11